MFDFEKPKIDIVEIGEDNRYGRFVIEPLERGYGTTLGNSLRRIMLSSLPGAAISSVKIEGVLHEFSSIPGVKEDVAEVIMNLKNLSIKNNSDSPEPKVAYIEFEGEGIVTAADIQADPDIEIINADLPIATLSGGADSKLFLWSLPLLRAEVISVLTKISQMINQLVLFQWIPFTHLLRELIL